MFDLTKKITQGIKGTLLVKDNGGFSHSGPWKTIVGETLVERWYVGEISSAEFTIAVDLDINNKEIVKLLVTNTANNANLVIYSRNYTNIQLVDLSVVVNNSFCELYISTTNNKIEGAKFFYTTNYFLNQSN